MDAQHKDMARIHEMAGSLTASPTKGLTAAFRVSTSDPAVALRALEVFRVGVFAMSVGVSAAVMRTWGHSRQQSAELALNEDNDDDGHSPERLEPSA